MVGPPLDFLGGTPLINCPFKSSLIPLGSIVNVLVDVSVSSGNEMVSTVAAAAAAAVEGSTAASAVQLPPSPSPQPQQQPLPPPLPLPSTSTLVAIYSPSASISFLLIALTLAILALVVGLRLNGVRVFNRKVKDISVYNSLATAYFACLSLG